MQETESNTPEDRAAIDEHAGLDHAKSLDFAKSAECFRRAVKVRADLGQNQEEALDRFQLAIALEHSQGRPKDVVMHYKKALMLFQLVGRTDWQVRTLTDEPLSISFIGIARFLPLVLFSLLAGVVADHFNRRKVTILTQLAQAVAAMTLGFTTAAGITSLWMLFGLVVIQAVAVTFDIPARQALVAQSVPAY